MYTLYPFYPFFFCYVLSVKGGISKVGISIVLLYFFEEYFLFPFVFKQNSPFSLVSAHNASHNIHFSIKALMFTLLNSL